MRALRLGQSEDDFRDFIETILYSLNLFVDTKVDKEREREKMQFCTFQFTDGQNECHAMKHMQHSTSCINSFIYVKKHIPFELQTLLRLSIDIR